MVRKALISIGLVTTLAAPAMAGETYTFDKQHTEAAFQVRHLFTKVRGTFRDFSGNVNWDKAKPENSTVEFRLKTASVDTGVEQRDTHLRSDEFFWAEKHPDIVFKSTKIVAKSATAFVVTGDLTIRGVTRSVTLPVTILGEQKDPWGNVKAGFETSTTLNRKDYGLTWNKALEAGGMLVGDEVEIQINIEAGKDVPKPTAN
jgi:polyisoprenoid-binding protein YceI